MPTKWAWHVLFFMFFKTCQALTKFTTASTGCHHYLSSYSSMCYFSLNALMFNALLLNAPDIEMLKMDERACSATQVRTHAQKYFMRLARSSKQGGNGFKACDLGAGSLSERDDGDFDSISFSGNLGAENAAAAAAAAACGKAGTSAAAAAAFLAAGAGNKKNIQHRDGDAVSSSQVASQQTQGSTSNCNGKASKASTQHQQHQQKQQQRHHQNEHRLQQHAQHERQQTHTQNHHEHQQQKMLHISAETGVNPKRHFFSSLRSLPLCMRTHAHTHERAHTHTSTGVSSVPFESEQHL